MNTDVNVSHACGQYNYSAESGPPRDMKKRLPSNLTGEGLLVNKDTHRPYGGPMPLGLALP